MIGVSAYIDEVRDSLRKSGRSASAAVPSGPVDRLGLPPSAFNLTADQARDELYRKGRDA